jgi:hypothetical protein
MTRHRNQGGAATSDAVHASYVTNPREASPDESIFLFFNPFKVTF